ncbi:hypothetical protein [Bacillus thuringiensis]|uniref:hypothetical protein n=1 Tax=Bacillus thuringiensis TaxID=1428 RepID=UPI0026E36B5E|nr:hypothetical protein [Bacillus thuringiensis]MDO6630506.1 hypothetical protein [Bacillus thuringiensis]MDO6660669.1 hypothetical protein [Bacillus thuringiensis]MDO6700600.1 hypothetical protein [Bacillus thuringiensis]
MYTKYGWKFAKYDYDKGTILFGFHFNSNDEWGEDEREVYVSIDLFKIGITMGKFHYTA